MATKEKPALGFPLDDLETEMNHYNRAPASSGRPRALAPGARPVSVRLTAEQHEWTLREAASRTLATGERFDVSRLVRELIDRAMHAAS